MAQQDFQRFNPDGLQILQDEIPDRDALQQQINAVQEESNAIREESNVANPQQMAAQLRDQIVQIAHVQAQLGGHIAGLRGEILQLQDQVELLQNEQQLLPMRLYNASTSELAPLRYPAAIPNDHILPAAPRHLLAFTENQLQAASQALGLPALPAKTLVEDRRRQTADYIGVPYCRDALPLLC